MTSETKKRISAINSGIIPEGYKKTKVGIMPVEWKYVRLSKITEMLIERAGNNKYETLSISAGVGFVNQANKFGKELSGKQYEKYIVLHKGDFSYNKGNSKKYPQGCIYQLKDREVAAVPNVFESFYLTKGDNDYFEQLFMSGYLNSQLFAKINHGVRDDGLLNLKGEDFYSCYIPFPPLPEQQKIAEILSTQDKLIELYERKIEQLKTLKKGYLQKMFPKKGCKYPELRFKGFTDPWEQRKFSEIADTRRGLTYKPSSISERGVRVLRSSNINEDTFVFGNDDVFVEESAVNIPYVNDGDILITSANGSTRLVGKHTIIRDLLQNPTIHGGFMIVASSKNPDFLNASMSSYWYSQFISLYVSGGNGSIGNLNKNDLDMQIVFVPNEEEQQQIGSYFKNLDRLITLHQHKLDKEKQKKKALMQLLLTGKVRVST